LTAFQGAHAKYAKFKREVRRGEAGFDEVRVTRFELRVKANANAEVAAGAEERSEDGSSMSFEFGVLSCEERQRKRGGAEVNL
jgi:hypothetical protein